MRYHVTIGLVLTLGIATLASAGQPTKRPTDAQRGKELYERHCVQCHGASNQGDGPATVALVHEVPNLQGKTSTDDAAVKIVTRGKNAMPGFETSFDAADARRVLKHMAGLGSKEAKKPEPEPEEPNPEDEGDEGDAQIPGEE